MYKKTPRRCKPGGNTKEDVTIDARLASTCAPPITIGIASRWGLVRKDRYDAGKEEKFGNGKEPGASAPSGSSGT